MTDRVVFQDKIWVLKDKSLVKIGFTNDFLKTLTECWHILPAGISSEVKEKDPLLAIETNDSLISIPSPVSGTITYFNESALNFPEHLNELECVVTVDLSKSLDIKPRRNPQQNQLDDVLGALPQNQWFLEGLLAHRRENNNN